MHIVRRLLSCILVSPVEKVWVIDHSPHPAFTFSGLDGVASINPTQGNPDTQIEYLHLPNKGYGAGNNVAIRLSMTEGYRYHLVLNPDVYWDNGIIEELMAYMDSHPRVGLVMPKVLYPDGRFQLQAKPLPGLTDFLLSRIGLRRRLQKKWIEKLSRLDDPVEMPFLSGCFMLLRNETLAETGLFDERFFMYCEDLDLTRRIARRYSTVYYPRVSIYHDYNRESTRSARLFLHHMVSAFRYLAKWRNGG